MWETRKENGRAVIFRDGAGRNFAGITSEQGSPADIMHGGTFLSQALAGSGGAYPCLNLRISSITKSLLIRRVHISVSQIT